MHQKTSKKTKAKKSGNTTEITPRINHNSQNHEMTKRFRSSKGNQINKTSSRMDSLLKMHWMTRVCEWIVSFSLHLATAMSTTWSLRPFRPTMIRRKRGKNHKTRTQTLSYKEERLACSLGRRDLPEFIYCLIT